jgi:hypothetical protein
MKMKRNKKEPTIFYNIIILVHLTIFAPNLPTMRLINFYLPFMVAKQENNVFFSLPIAPKKKKFKK